VSTKIGGGDVTKIDCPSADCDELIPPHTVKELGGRKDADSTKYTMVSQAELEFPAISTGLL